MTLSSPVGPSNPSVLMRAAAWITFLRSEASPPLMTDSTRLTDCGGPRPAFDPRPASAGLSRPGSLFVTKDEWRPVNLVWLVYSGFFFIEPLQRNTRTVWLTFAGAYACFLAIYLLLMAVRPGTNRAVLLLALAVLGAAYYPFNSGAGGMLIYVAAFAPFMTESLLLAGTLIGAAALITAIEGVLLHLTPWSWAMMSFLSASIGVGNLFGAARVRANERLNLAQEQIEHLATIAERERIARDMHDVLGHTLSVVVLKSELAGKLVGNDVERARQEIVEVEQIARQALTEVREAIRGYRADGIAAEIARARRTLQAAGVRLECEAEGARLAPALESVLSLVLREAVTNILRHAGATSCRLELAADSRGTRLSVHDNGRGAIEEEGVGLRGMRQRVEALGGRLEIDSRRGTRLTAEIPHAASA